MRSSGGPTLPYVPDRLAYRRRASRAVQVGSIQIGGQVNGRPAPLIVQSMCTTPTQDVAATVAQCLLLARAGCQLVRITAPGVKDAQALRDIRHGVSLAGFAHLPLVADIHFMPAAAMEAVEHVEKVRINPGNFADKKRFAVKEYSDQDYAEELERVAERFRPLVRRAKTLGRALRIGTNHGSLSDRIMNRFGDSPRGMVESAMEFILIAESEGFRDLVISMKSSNPKVMVHAYRLLCARLDEHQQAYPLHLGVTEAGDGEDGRAKGAAGIASLLEDGIGDTVRVSLTEPPEDEIPVARALCARYEQLPAINAPASRVTEHIDPYAYRRRISDIIRIGAGVAIGGGLLPRVLAPQHAPAAPSQQPAADAMVDDTHLWGAQAHSIPGADGCKKRTTAIVGAMPPASMRAGADHLVPLAHITAGCGTIPVSQGSLVLLRLGDEDPVDALNHTLAQIPDGVMVGLAEPGLIGEVRAYRLLAAVIDERFANAERAHAGSGRRPPVCVALPFQRDELALCAIAGSLLIDGIGDALYLPVAADPRRLAFTILQAVKARVTRADYVACPSCGRTLFDLIEVTAHIKEVTNHLDGVTIAIMGCIVNGPGEMADADFGFVGSGPGKVDLYRGKEKVHGGIPFNQARALLVALIKQDGKWKEPPLLDAPTVNASSINV